MTLQNQTRWIRCLTTLTTGKYRQTATRSRRTSSTSNLTVGLVQMWTMSARQALPSGWSRCGQCQQVKPYRRAGPDVDNVSTSSLTVWLVQMWTMSARQALPSGWSRRGQCQHVKPYRRAGPDVDNVSTSNPTVGLVQTWTM